MNKILDKISTLLLLIWAVCGVYLIHNPIIGKSIIFNLFLIIFTLKLLICGWCFFGKEDSQSFEFLFYNNLLEFVIRGILVILALVIAFYNHTFFIGFLIVVFLFYKICFFGDSKYSLEGNWRKKEKFMVLRYLVVFVVFFAALLSNF